MTDIPGSPFDQHHTHGLAPVSSVPSQEALKAEGQREVNLLWERTQAKIALAIVYATLLVAGVLSLSAIVPGATEKQVALAITAFMLISSLSTLVIGFYYGRTNHQRTGGVGGDSVQGSR